MEFNRENLEEVVDNANGNSEKITEVNPAIRFTPYFNYESKLSSPVLKEITKEFGNVVAIDGGFSTNDYTETRVWLDKSDQSIDIGVNESLINDNIDADEMAAEINVKMLQENMIEAINQTENRTELVEELIDILEDEGKSVRKKTVYEFDLD